MRLTQLRSFNAVASTMSFTKAAQMLNVSQPTITTQVGQLEELYKSKLFFRAGRETKITPLGRELFEISSRIFQLEADAIQLLRDSGELRTGKLRISAVGPSHVPKMIYAFHQKYPNINLSVSTGNSSEVLDKLAAYKADLGVLANTHKDTNYVSVPYSRHPLVIFCNTHHKFANRKSISIKELEGESFIWREEGSTTRIAFESALQKHNIQVASVMEVASREIIREAVIQGMGISAVLEVEFVAGDELRAVYLADEDIYTHTHIVCLAERKNDRVIEAFFKTLGINI